MLMTESRQPTTRTTFRNTLNQLMVKHEVYQWKELLEKLNEVGYSIGQSRLSQYVNRKRNPEEPEEFFEAIALALGLDEEEERRLAHSFLYPVQPDIRNLRAAEEIEEAAEEDLTNGDGEPESH